MRIAIETETTATPRPNPATSIPGSTSAEVAAGFADVREECHAAGRDDECTGERPAYAVAADDVAGRVRADSCCQREGDEGEAGGERPHAEDVLQVERAEQEEAEDRTGRGEHEEEAAADGAIRQPLDAQERCIGAALERSEGSEAREAAETEEQSLERRPAGGLDPG